MTSWSRRSPPVRMHRLLHAIPATAATMIPADAANIHVRARPGRSGRTPVAGPVGRRLERRPHFARPLISSARLFLQAALNHSSQRLRRMRRKRRWRVVQDGRAHLEGCTGRRMAGHPRPSHRNHSQAHTSLRASAASPRSCSGDMYGQRAQPSIGSVSGTAARVVPSSAPLFRDTFRQPEVQHFDAAFWRDHDVGAFQITMHDAAIVRMSDAHRRAEVQFAVFLGKHFA